MTVEAVRSFPARGLVVPVIRSLVTMTRIEMERARWSPSAIPEDLNSELATNADHLAHTIEHLMRIASVRDATLGRVHERLLRLASPETGTETLNEAVEEVVRFCTLHHQEFREAYLRDVDSFRRSHEEAVGRAGVLLLHGREGENQATSIACSLRDSCWYDVEVARRDRREQESPSDMTALYAAKPEDVRTVLPTPDPDVVLSDVGSPKRGFNMRLGRYLARVDRSRTSVLFRPFSTTRLLGTFEAARFRKKRSKETADAFK